MNNEPFFQAEKKKANFKSELLETFCLTDDMSDQNFIALKYFCFYRNNLLLPRY